MFNQPARRTVLVTGAAGNIGRVFCRATAADYDLKCFVRPTDGGLDELRKLGSVFEGDLSDLPGLKEAFAGVDTVIHLAGDPDPAAVWHDLLETNIVGTYHVFAAAKSAGVRRVIYASSIHAVSGYPADYQVHTTDPVNPGDLYGVSKCFGEALGRYMSGQEGLSVICLRIGGFQPDENIRGDAGVPMLDAWVSHRDLVQLIRRCVDAADLPFAIFHGLSDNRFKRLDISDARRLVGYAPQDDSTRTSAEIAPARLADRVQAHALADGLKSGLRQDV